MNCALGYCPENGPAMPVASLVLPVSRSWASPAAQRTDSAADSFIILDAISQAGSKTGRISLLCRMEFSKTLDKLGA